MILSDDEVTERLNSPDNLMNQIKRDSSVSVIPLPTQGRQKGDVAIGDHMRDLLAITRKTGEETLEDISIVFGVAPSTISNAARGLNGDGSYDKELANVGNDLIKRENLKIEEKEEAAHSEALDILMGSLQVLKPMIASGSGMKASEAASIAKTMSGIASEMRKPQIEITVNPTKVVLFAPRMKEEKEYEIIDVESSRL